MQLVDDHFRAVAHLQKAVDRQILKFLLLGRRRLSGGFALLRRYAIPAVSGQPLQAARGFGRLALEHLALEGGFVQGGSNGAPGIGRARAFVGGDHGELAPEVADLRAKELVQIPDLRHLLHAPDRVNSDEVGQICQGLGIFGREVGWVGASAHDLLPPLLLRHALGGEELALGLDLLGVGEVADFEAMGVRLAQALPLFRARGHGEAVYQDALF
mmetsp:Transcript_26302/g.73563  ORF Transcript_26302/g.73563 Transcript_26302/m.73563 type:complete len:215 (-) Transcript_26302:881-1525(-)